MEGGEENGDSLNIRPDRLLSELNGRAKQKYTFMYSLSCSREGNWMKIMFTFGYFSQSMSVQ
jgi:hypothetical protein